MRLKLGGVGGAGLGIRAAVTGHEIEPMADAPTKICARAVHAGVEKSDSDAAPIEAS